MNYYQHHIGDFDKATRHLTRNVHEACTLRHHSCTLREQLVHETESKKVKV